jgi:hypothetical protein
MSQLRICPLDFDFNFVPDEWTNRFVVTTVNVHAVLSSPRVLFTDMYDVVFSLYVLSHKASSDY